jgi:cytochrome P450
MKLSEIPLVSGALPFLGHARELRADRLRFIERASREKPDAGRILAFGRQVLLVTSPAIVHDIFVEKARAFEKTPQLRMLLYLLVGEGLFTAEGDLWKRQRRLMSPLFQASGIGRYVGLVAEVVERAAERFVPGRVIDVGREMTRITMGVVGKALFDADAFDEADELGDALTVALAWFNEQLGTPRLAFQMAIRDAIERAEGRVPPVLEGTRLTLLRELRRPVLLPGAYGRRLQGAIARLDAKIQAMIDARRAAPHPPDDLLTRLLKARDEDGSRMSDRQVRDEAVTLFVAGHETTATALTWAFYEIARAPRVREKLLAEADAIRSDADLGDPARTAYAVRVFKEAMRLYPPVYMLPRRAREPVTVGPYELPKRSLVFASPYAIHRRPDLYPDPERFDPDRFTPEAEERRPRAAYIPFGVGPRVCIGNHFALMEGPLVLLSLLRRVELDVAPRRVDPMDFATLRPGAPVMATIRSRETSREAAE